MTAREQKILKGVVKILRDRLHPARIYLFGSRAKGNARYNSDFDFAVDQKCPAAREALDLEDLIDGVRGLYKVDIVYLKSVSKPFRDVVRRTAKVLYERRSS